MKVNRKDKKWCVLFRDWLLVFGVKDVIIIVKGGGRYEGIVTSGVIYEKRSPKTESRWEGFSVDKTYQIVWCTLQYKLIPPRERTKLMVVAEKSSRSMSARYVSIA